MHWIHLISLTILTGTVFTIRCLVIPSLESLPRGDAVPFMGKLMPRVRLVLRVGLIMLLASAAGLFLRDDTAGFSSREVTLILATVAATLSLLPSAISPHRRLAPKVERHRKSLFTISLFLLILLAALSHAL